MNFRFSCQYTIFWTKIFVERFWKKWGGVSKYISQILFLVCCGYCNNASRSKRRHPRGALSSAECARVVQKWEKLSVDLWTGQRVTVPNGPGYKNQTFGGSCRWSLIGCVAENEYQVKNYLCTMVTLFVDKKFFIHK